MSFEVRHGERLCLLGPSGCGKTTTLQAIAGFVEPTAGVIEIEGQDVTRLPAERREIGIVFQNYALFPHLSCFENVAFGLRMRKQRRTEIEDRVRAVLGLVGLEGHSRKMPAQLSGGEQQRIAFARAIVTEPRLLLLDEPFSNLDARLRQELRRQSMELLEQLRITTVMVTHDQEEAMYIADRIVVMRDGHIEQVGDARAVYHQPPTLFAARFVGESNVLRGIVTDPSREDGSVGVDIDGVGNISGRGPATLTTGSKATVLIRPESLRIGAHNNAGGDDLGTNRAAGRLERVANLGYRTEFHVRVGHALMVAWSLGDQSSADHPTEVVITWSPRDTHVFPAD